MENGYLFKNFKDLTPEESDEILIGRNQKMVRQSMSSNRKISLAEHKSFIESLKFTHSKVYFRVERFGKFVGVYSVTDISNNSATGGFWITEDARLKLLGLSIVFFSIDYIFKKFNFDELFGCQLSENRRAERLNTLLGFETYKPSEKIDPRMVYLRIKKDFWIKNTANNKMIMRLISVAESRNEDKYV
jgi:RimJ/RimL family protein N-acetyltransferase